MAFHTRLLKSVVKPCLCDCLWLASIIYKTVCLGIYFIAFSVARTYLHNCQQMNFFLSPINE